jgi:plastocyanin
MAHTDITLTDAQGVFVPSQPQVSVVKGDTVSFSSSDGSQVVLFFSSGATSVLSPSPSVPITVEVGKKAEFTFTSSEAGAYSVFFEREASSAPAHFPVRQSNELLLEIDSGGSFGGQSNPVKG